MRRAPLALACAALGALSACATSAPQPAEPAAALPTTRAVQLARVRCLVVAPLENASDDPLAPEAATGALVAAVDPNRTRVYPIEELRALFRGTPLELPEGVSPSLALELGELVGADAVLYGSVEGRSRGSDGDITITVRLAATGVRDTLFWRSVRVTTEPNESSADAARRAALEAAQPFLDRLGVPGKKTCFEKNRIERVRVLAGTAEKVPPPANGVTAPLPPPPPPATPVRPSAPVVAPAPAPVAPSSTATATPTATATATAGVPLPIPLPPPPLPPPPAAAAPAKPALTARQAQWSDRLAAGQRFVVEDVAFAGRTPRLEKDGGLADLAKALLATPGVKLKLEGFVDASRSARDDSRASMEFARTAGRRLVELGVPRDRVTWAGRGGEAPIAPNFTARGRATNRRVEAVVQ